jgi:hypothetical protein
MNASYPIRSVRKVKLVWALATLGLIASALLVAGRAHAESLGFSLSSTPAPGAAAQDISVRVLDDETQKPLADASVSLSNSLIDDSGTVRAQTGADGNSLFKGALSRDARTLTVSKDGYATISVVGLQSTQVTIYLKALPSAQLEANPTVIASGSMSGWVDSSDVKAGLVLKTLGAMDLLHFDASSLISPLKDTIDVMGSHEIPSNLVLPEQQVWALFVPITLNKPTYRLPLARGKTVRIAGVQGTISTDDLIALTQNGGKLSLELLNKLKFNRAGINLATQANTDFQANVNANLVLRPTHRVSPSQPPFAADVLVASATDIDGVRGTLLPTDIKLAANQSNPSQINTVQLSACDASAGRDRDVITIATADKGHRMSGIITAQAGSSVRPGEYLAIDGLSDTPTVPDTVTLSPLATGVAAALYETANAPVWYVYALPTAGVSQVPARRLPGNAAVKSYSMIQLDFGAGFDSSALDGQTVMKSLKRFARATAKVGTTFQGE